VSLYLARHWWIVPVILATLKEAQPGQIAHETQSRQYPTPKRAGDVVQVIEHLLSKCEALSSNLHTTKTKKHIFGLLSLKYHVTFYKPSCPIYIILK
jgi:hypothetical protein